MCKKDKNQNVVDRAFAKLNDVSKCLVLTSMLLTAMIFIGSFMSCFSEIFLLIKINIMPLVNCCLTFGILGLVLAVAALIIYNFVIVYNQKIETAYKEHLTGQSYVNVKSLDDEDNTDDDYIDVPDIFD